MIDFSEEVHLKKYKKMDYQNWRDLTMASNRLVYGGDCEILFTNSTVIITMTGNNWYFHATDDSFGQYLFERFKELSNIINAKENDKPMDIKKNFNFDFGPCNSERVRLSMYGLAIENTAGTYVSYNEKDDSIIDVEIFNFKDAGKYLFKMPVAIKDIKKGDVIVHNRVPVFVTGVSEDGQISVVDIRAGERKDIILTKNMFGFDYATKVVSLFNAVDGAPTPDKPFGNMLPFLMMEGGEIDPMMMMLMAQNQGGETANLFNNPMLLYCMMKGKNDDILPLMMMMNQK